MTTIAPLPTRTLLTPLATSGDFSQVPAFYRQHRINGVFLTPLTWPALPRTDDTDIAEIGSGMTGLSGATPLSGGLSIRLSPAGATLTIGSALGLSGQSALSAYDYRLVPYGQVPIEQRHSATLAIRIAPVVPIHSQQSCEQCWFAHWAQPIRLSADLPVQRCFMLAMTAQSATLIETGSPPVLSDSNAPSDYSHTLVFVPT